MLGTDSEHGRQTSTWGGKLYMLGVLAGVGTIQEGRYHRW